MAAALAGRENSGKPVRAKHAGGRPQKLVDHKV